MSTTIEVFMGSVIAKYSRPDPARSDRVQTDPVLMAQVCV